MGSFSIWHWLIVLLIVLVLFGRGRVADIMGEISSASREQAQGIEQIS